MVTASAVGAIEIRRDHDCERHRSPLREVELRHAFVRKYLIVGGKDHLMVAVSAPIREDSSCDFVVLYFR